MKKIQIMFCGLFIGFISIFGILTLMNNNEISYKEGRKLTTFPDITLENLLKDNFYEQYTEAFADQLYFRENFIKYYYLINFQKYIGDVIKGKDNQLFLSPLIISNKEKYIKQLKKTINDNMNDVAKKVNNEGAEFIFLSIPRKDIVMNEYLPDSYISGVEDYKEFVKIIKDNISEDVNFIDAYEVFEEKNVYYQTDHHLNIRGAYNLFKEIIEIVNNNYEIEVKSLEDEYDIESVVINGSFNRKIGQSVSAGKEELILKPKIELEYKRYDNGKKVDTKIFGEGNTYAEAYMGGDIAETVVTTNNEGPNILIVGSSYTNILESLSVYKFKTMVSIDYRDNKTGKSIEDYVKEYDIDYVVFICSQSTNSLSISSIKEHLGLNG